MEILDSEYKKWLIELKKNIRYTQIKASIAVNSALINFYWELGKGFAIIGQQYHLQISDNDYYIGLLFYHTKLKCYVVIELKNTKFMPKYAGKLNFYLSAIDSLVKDENNIEAEFALRDISKPIGISELKLVENLPENLKSSLPTIEEIEAEYSTLDP